MLKTHNIRKCANKNFQSSLACLSLSIFYLKTLRRGVFAAGLGFMNCFAWVFAAHMGRSHLIWGLILSSKAT